MRAVVINETGSPDVLVLQDLPNPVASGDQVLIDVAFCGCNWADTQVRAGIYPHPLTYPMVLGFEISGVIAAIGPDVRNLKVGQRVCAIAERGGGYAEQIVVSERDVMPLPDQIPLDVAAAFPIQALTAYHMLHSLYNLKAGDTVLCHAIGGGVGLYVTQLAKHAGATVIGTLGTKGKERLPLELGADHVINYNEEDFVAAIERLTGGRGIDLAIDSLGATTLDRTYGLMRYLGHVINIGEAEGEPFKNIRERILPKSLTFTRFHLQHVGPGTALWNKGRDYVMQGIIDGWLKVQIVETFPLADAPEMHRRLEGRSVAGKLLLEPKR